MHEALDVLVVLARPLCAAHASVVTNPAERQYESIEALIAGAHRKCRLVESHLRFLGALDWRLVGTAGAYDPRRDSREPLRVACGDVEYRFFHPDAVVLQVYAAFDGVVTGCVNATDTLGRALNLSYRLGIKDVQASLGRLTQVSDAQSPLGRVLRAASTPDWLAALRTLRGRCQHAELDHVLIRPSGPLGQLTQPEVPADCCPAGISHPGTMIAYATGAGGWLAQTINGICAAVTQHEASAVRPVS